jgi:hypothetical protein
MTIIRITFGKLNKARAAVQRMRVNTRERRRNIALREVFELIQQAQRFDFATSLVPEDAAWAERAALLAGEAISRRERAHRLCVTHGLDFERVQNLTNPRR